MKSLEQFLVSKLSETACVQRIMINGTKIILQIDWDILKTLDTEEMAAAYRKSIIDEIEQIRITASKLFGNKIEMSFIDPASIDSEEWYASQWGHNTTLEGYKVIYNVYSDYEFDEKEQPWLTVRDLQDAKDVQDDE